MDRRALLAVVLSLLILIAYEQFLRLYYNAPTTQQHPAGAVPGEETPLPTTPHSAALEERGPGTPEETQPSTESPAVPERIVRVESPFWVAEFSTRGARLVSWRLKKYRTTVEPDSPPLELVLPAPEGEALFAAELRGPAVPKLQDRQVAYDTEAESVVVSSGEPAQVTFRGRVGGADIIKTFQFQGDRYSIAHTLKVENAPPGYNEVAISWSRALEPKKGPPMVFSKAAYLEGKKLHEQAFRDLEKGVILTGELWWTGFTDHYFFLGLALDVEADATRRLWLKDRGAWVEQKWLVPLSERALSLQATAYLGPKDVDALELAGHRFERAVDLGWFGFIAVPLLHVMQFFHRFTGNYGIDIILLTVLVKILFVPLTQSSFKSMQQLQKLQPQMAKIREKYKDDPQQMNKEMLELYRRHKVNPLGGCLPMLLQLPVFIGLYSALTHAVELRHAPFVWWIRDLSAPDRLGSVAIPFVEPPGIPVLTILMGASMFVQQWMTPSVGDPAQRQVMLLMPILFTFMFIGFPSGLTLYWLVNNVLTIVQQYYMTRTNK
ncbi:MAG: membrane protein insertase YidC [Candidatus Binatia bacterium]|nr:MAG: membrane protein insertase YidC [Candidatus Binatia bacterium]